MWVKKYNDGRPIKSWCDDVEPKMMQQAYNLAALPFAHHHIALMPDAHLGYGMPIGGVLAADGVIIPYAVGNDIGCRMSACRTNIVASWVKESGYNWQWMVNKIKEQIPMGPNHREIAVSGEALPPLPWPAVNGNGFITDAQFCCAKGQLGTLGGGNHFIEIQQGSDNHIWVMIHSGSRRIGMEVCQFHHKVAQKLNEKWHTSVPKAWQLAFLPLDSREGFQYVSEMNWCIDFAKRSHEMMMSTIMGIMGEEFPDFEAQENITAVHNFARMEQHFGKNVMVHRKGATPAYDKQLGIIPGNQAGPSYIVEGLGNKESFCSCSHGAGRPMSRSDAKKKLDLATEQAKMGGIIHDMNSQSDLDEAPGAYKDIEAVIAAQTDLVKVLHQLTPLAVMKGKR